MDADRDVAEIFDGIPFAEDLGIELTHAADGRAEGRLDLAARHTSNERTGVVHGGVTYSLADTVGGAAVYSAVGSSTPTPTVDMRIDYLAPATGEALNAEADVVRNGNSVCTVDVTVTDGDGTRIAEARGVYKTGGGDDETPWTAGVDRSESEFPERE